LAQGSSQPAYYWLVGIALAGVVISIYYYFGIVRVMFWSEPGPDKSAVKASAPIRAALYACAAGMFVLGVYPNWMVNLADAAARTLR
jgi:NADH-quinone oxidoreductase subunit N